jgi:hypothetical protein
MSGNPSSSPNYNYTDQHPIQAEPAYPNHPPVHAVAADQNHKEHPKGYQEQQQYGNQQQQQPQFQQQQQPQYSNQQQQYGQQGHVVQGQPDVVYVNPQQQQQHGTTTVYTSSSENLNRYI